jgi:hypothetical protein
MRTKVFRVLAGLLALLFLGFLLFGDHTGRTLRELVGFWTVCCLFGLFALFGTEPAERFLCYVSGMDYKEPNRK